MSDIAQSPSSGRNLIEAYGDGGFTIAGNKIIGSLLVFPSSISAWTVQRPEDITLDSLAEVFGQDPAVELLLVGCGLEQTPPPADLRHALSAAGLVADFMNTGAACRTFNVLLAEDRRVAAALIAVP
ncbi:MAG: Mth938-like domain-containing protein [Alphaproteobacteria bacterium]|nr:Mth938-like domain-containing protein [Alphaproteobacteria bacterium]